MEISQRPHNLHVSAAQGGLGRFSREVAAFDDFEQVMLN